ncbi:MAG: Na+-transporting NADH:ubiquinone oxidoreductase, subunit NqrF [Halonotius sp. J07HN4]|nr:MAG: Na+-transporting NADH:ubiquinone oxidoreductase, subunit NqrF [Halonotius sp. J07HN4]
MYQLSCLKADLSGQYGRFVSVLLKNRSERQVTQTGGALTVVADSVIAQRLNAFVAICLCMDDTVRVVVETDDGETELTVQRGRTLRDVLREAGHSPYTALTERANCGGRGLCATCGVRLETEVAPDHWHDELAERFGYPRLSCQVTVDRDLRVRLVDDKLVWGGRE